MGFILTTLVVIGTDCINSCPTAIWSQPQWPEKPKNKTKTKTVTDCYILTGQQPKLLLQSYTYITVSQKLQHIILVVVYLNLTFQNEGVKEDFNKLHACDFSLNSDLFIY